ncbi:Repetin [Streptomyces sp. NPDC002057]|uniref:Repetin n=1 Tax=Streptomyces sp. NPDC002057 TaxID=3154664 RepID=UPI00333106A4
MNVRVNRRTKITALAAALLITAGTAGSAVASGDGGPGTRTAEASRTRTHQQEAAALTGTAKLYRPAGDDITFTFDAHLAKKDSADPMKATGTFTFSHYKGDWGGRATVKVDCLTTGGKVAVVTGIVTDTDVEDFRNKRVGVTVHDLGKKDRLGYSWASADPRTDVVAPCLSGAPFERIKAGTGDFKVTPWEFVYPTE